MINEDKVKNPIQQTNETYPRGGFGGLRDPFTFLKKSPSELSLISSVTQ